MNKMPYIENGTFYLDGRPHILRAGEVHNSSSASLAYMEEKVWPMLEGLHLDTLLAPIAWESVEPEEGKYTFELLQGLIEQARKHGVRLVLLWFGLWKNAESNYVPGWVKRDTANYRRVMKQNGEPLNTVSPLCAETVRRDAQAFTALMLFLKTFDAQAQTVIMVQIENEMGILGSDRDYHPDADTLFFGEVPQPVAQAYGQQGTWQSVFGKDAAEHFMAFHFAAATQQIASAGRAVYPLPCYVNAWLEQWPWLPGTYPSGGPQAKMQKMWKAVAPSISCLAADIYVPYIADVCDEYSRGGNPLMVSEARKDVGSVTSMMHAVLGQGAFCYAPFGVEDLLPGNVTPLPSPPPALMEELNIDPSAFDTVGSFDYFSAVNAFIKEIEPLYFAHRDEAGWQCHLKRNEYHYGEVVELDGLRLMVQFKSREQNKPTSGCGVWQMAPGKVLIYGMRCGLKLLPNADTDKKPGVLSLSEAAVQGGEVKVARVLNGDERMMLALGDRLTVLLLEYYSY